MPMPAYPVAKPTAATVFGILNIIFGVLGLCGLIFSAAILFVPNDMQANNYVFEIMQESAGYRTFLLVSSVIGVIFTIILIVSGIGLLAVKPYGRTLAIAYGVYAIIGGIAGAIGNYIFLIQPLMDQAASSPQQTGAIGGAFGGMIGGCIGLIYPIVLLIFMFNRKFIAAMEQYNRGLAGDPYTEPWQQPPYQQ